MLTCRSLRLPVWVNVSVGSMCLCLSACIFMSVQGSLYVSVYALVYLHVSV